MTRSYTPSQIGGGILAGEFTRGSAFVPLAEVEQLTRDRAALLAEVERLRAKRANNDWLLAECERLQGLLRGLSRDMVEEIEKLTRERNEARAEVARLLLESEVLAKHEGSPGREWHSAGAWLLPGDTINVVRAPLEAKP